MQGFGGVLRGRGWPTDVCLEKLIVRMFAEVYAVLTILT